MNSKMSRSQAVEWLEARLPVRPGSKALKVAQDRLLEKAMARELGAKPPCSRQWQPARS
jgi:phosphoribosylaminoimidazole carboxylase (NCAIR synthetase)